MAVCVYVRAYMYVVCGEEMITCYNAVMARVVMRVFVRLVDIVYCGETRKGSGEIRCYSLRISHTK